MNFLFNYSMNQYSDHLKQILIFSKEEAERLNNIEIHPEHLFLGIIRDGHGIAIEALKKEGVDLADLKRNIEWNLFEEHKANNENGESEIKDTVLAKDADRTLKLSQLEARMLRHSSIDSEDVVLAILKDESCSLSQMLQKYNVDYGSFYRQLAQLEKIKPSEQNNLKATSLFEEENEEKESVYDSEDDPEDDYEEVFSNNGNKAHKTANSNNSKGESNTPMLDNFSFDLTKAAAEGQLDPVVGRETEIERLAQILSRRRKNNPVLLGEPGVGKTAIVEGLAQRIIERKVSWLLADKRVVRLDLASLVAGTKYRGQFEERLKNLLKELQQNKNIILYIDEIHNIIGAGNAEGSMDAANLLKPALSRGEIQCIGSTTLDEYRKSIEKDGALERRFQKIIVEPTSIEDTITILHNIKGRYEEHHNVTYTDAALEACVTLTDRYITDRNLPDKAIDAMDEAGSKMHLFSSNEPADFTDIEAKIEDIKKKKDNAILTQNYEEAASYRDQQRHLEKSYAKMKEEWKQRQKDVKPVVDQDKIAEVVSQITEIPISKVAASESEKLLSLKSKLASEIIGQDEAINKVVKAIQRNRIGLKDPKKPIGTFLFLGPTGVGKTYLAKKIADEMFSHKDSLIRIDMSEFMEKYSTSRLIGAAPGYVGYDEGGQLTERVRRHPYSVVLFDEIEKADKEVYNIMLQIFDEGHLTDAQGRKIDFKNTIIILTSNVGSRQINEFGSGVGFSMSSEHSLAQMSQSILQKELKRTFSPEFLNRIDDIITFDQLSQESIRKIVDIELSETTKRIVNLGFTVDVADEVKEFLAKKGYDRNYGARPLKRAIQNYIEDALCEEILKHQNDKEKKNIKVTMPLQSDVQNGNVTPVFEFC